jgi:hypothetical protein
MAPHWGARLGTAATAVLAVACIAYLVLQG